MARYRDDGEVQIDNSTKVHFRNAFQQLIMIAALNVGTLLNLEGNIARRLVLRFCGSIPPNTQQKTANNQTRCPEITGAIVTGIFYGQAM
jgi:hypothetical protein